MTPACPEDIFSQKACGIKTFSTSWLIELFLNDKYHACGRLVEAISTDKTLDFISYFPNCYTPIVQQLINKVYFEKKKSNETLHMNEGFIIPTSIRRCQPHFPTSK